MDLSLPPAMRGRIVERVQGMSGVTSISLQVGASIQPPGDVLCIEATNEATLGVLKVLDEEGGFEAGSVTLSEPTAIISPPHLAGLDRQATRAPGRKSASSCGATPMSPSTTCC
jgi:hypothetical protein